MVWTTKRHGSIAERLKLLYIPMNLLSYDHIVQKVLHLFIYFERGNKWNNQKYFSESEWSQNLKNQNVFKSFSQFCIKISGDITEDYSQIYRVIPRPCKFKTNDNSYMQIIYSAITDILKFWEIQLIKT